MTLVTMRMLRRPPSRSRNSGVALVATLGLLAALLIMALSYAAFMRTERTAAANFSSAAQTRLLTLGALDTVIAEMNHNPAWRADGVIPLWPALIPPGGSEIAANVVYGTATQSGTKHYFPMPALLEFSTNPNNANIPSRWQEILTEDAEGNELLVGAYAAVVADETSHIDVNFAGLQVYDEGFRNSVSNLYMEALLPNGWESSWGYIAEWREDLFIHFYNQAEFRHSAKPRWPRVPGNANWADDTGLTTYSKFMQQYRPDLTAEDRNRVRINRPLAELNADRAEIEQAFADGGVADPQALFDSLIDYVDLDYEITDGPLSYGTEAVPMINEIVVSNRYTVTEVAVPNTDPPEFTYSITNSYQVGVEVWFPFVGEETNREYSVRLAADYVVPGLPPGFPVPGQAMAVGIEDFASSPLPEDQFKVFWSEVVSESAEVSNPPPPGLYTRAEVHILNGVVRQRYSPEAIVDQVPDSPRIVLEVGRYRLMEDEEIWVTAEVEDPRINWRASDWRISGSWIGPNHTLAGEAPDFPDGTNTVTVSSIGDDAHIYIANRPIRNVGELGFLALGDPNQPWTSVDLLDTHRFLLDTFTTHEFNPEVPEVFGLVNLNTIQPQVLMAALHGARIEQYPDITVTPIDDNSLEELAVSIIRYGNSFNGFTNRSDVVVVPQLWNGSYGPQNSENEKESILRNFIDMVDVRGNTYTVALAVRSVRDRTGSGPNPNAPDQVYDPDDDPTLGEQFAVAQVWRDPITKRSQITFFKWVARSDD